ncbi:MAG: branched-chain amino acid ABC transporter permease [Micromonosporaceae bacterium]|nr:branched-chain amino acid ABC transporter permease [Micromonosporaceae bacterium]
MGATSPRSPRSAGVAATAAVAVVGAVWCALLAAPLLVNAYTTSVLTRMMILGLVAVSVALMTQEAGLPTLGQTAPYAAGAYASALIGLHGHPTAVVGLFGAAIAGAGFAALTAPLVVHARGATVLMVTLAIGQLVVIAAGRWKAITGGTDGLIGIPAGPPLPGLPLLVTDRICYWYVLIVVTIIVALLAAALRTPLGLLLHASRDNEIRMRASGHRVAVHFGLAYVAAGAIAGIAGSLLASTQQYLSPADFGFETAAFLLLAVTMGASAPIVGSLVGAGVIFWTRDWLAGVFPGQAPLLLGVLFLLTALLGGRHARGTRH